MFSFSINLQKSLANLFLYLLCRNLKTNSVSVTIVSPQTLMNVAFLLLFVTPKPTVLTRSVPMFVRANPVLLEMEKLAAVRNGRVPLLVVTTHRITI